jgi:glucokinase
MTLTCGVDVGGTKIAGAVVDMDGRVLAEHRVESPATNTEAIEDAIAGLVTELGSRHRIEAVGVGAAGYVSRSRSVVMFAPNLAWRDVDLKAELEERVNVPVVIENDANAAAWGEFRFGAAEDADEMLLVTVGTGVGGGIIVNGELFRGSFGSAAEIGHLRMVPGGRLCGCGKLGCLEQYGSGSALVRGAREASYTPEAAALLAEAGGDPEKITGPMITELARAGDAFACAQLAEIGRWLGEGIASLAAVLDPAVVVIGGGVSEAEDLLVDPIRTAFEEHLTAREHRPVLEIRLATLGNRAGMLGAADLARR